MGLAQRIKKGLRKMIPAGTVVKYSAPPEKNQSTLTDEQLRSLKYRKNGPGRGTVGKHSDGIGVGP